MNDQSNRLVILIVGLASIFVVMFGIRGTASIINPILLASVITIIVLPIPAYLTGRGMPGWLALVMTILAVAFFLVLIIMTVFFSVTKLSVELPKYMADAAANASQDVPPDAMEPEQVGEIIIQLGPVAGNILSSVFGVLVQFALALAIFFFMISAAMALPDAVRLGLDPRAPAITHITSLTGDVRHYMTILTGINFLVGLGNTVFLTFLGVDFAVLWGLLAWFMGYIPSIGFMIALVPPLMMAYAQYGVQTALIVLIGYILINGGVQNFVQPRIMGQGLKISPVVVFVSLFVWGYLLGGVGALLAVPLTLLVLTVMENFESSSMIARLMRFTGGEKKEENQEAIKQVQGLWRRARGTLTTQDEPKGKPKSKK